MPRSEITQLSPAPGDLWRLYAFTEGDQPGDTVVYLSRVVSMGLVQDVDDLDRVTGQRVVPINAAAMTDPMVLHDCIKPQGVRGGHGSGAGNRSVSRHRAG